MATKKICDRCGAELDTPYAVFVVGIFRAVLGEEATTHELCEQCAKLTENWFRTVCDVGKKVEKWT